MKDYIYLDHHATTPCAPEVVQAMLPFFSECFGNPSSEKHRLGKLARQAVENARKELAKALGCSPHELVFTSGATEANNIAILGLAGLADRVKRYEILTTSIEHKSVLEPVRTLSNQGFTIRELQVDEVGRVNLDALKKHVSEETLLVSVQHANNEIGTIQDLHEISTIVHNKGALLHSDAAQSFGKMQFSVEDLEVDFLSLSAHKVYGPKGIGALYLKGGSRSLPIIPRFFGGGQEHELRPGTLNVPGIVGFGVAATLSQKGLLREIEHLRSIRERFESRLLSSCPEITINGGIEYRLPGNSSLRIAGLDGEAIIVNCPNLILSTGSACTSGALEPSHVLTAIGLSRDEAYETIRIGFGRYTTAEETDLAASEILQAISRLRALANDFV